MEFNTDRNTEEVENIAAAENDVGQRLDIYLAAKLEVSRSNMQKLLEEGRVFRGAKVFKANYKVKAGRCVHSYAARAGTFRNSF